MNLRTVTCGLAASAAFAAVPLAATAQTLTITSPSAGATLSGSTNPCGASAPSGTSYVRFYRDGGWMNTDTGSPYTCNIDASKLSSGTHKLTAVSYNSYNSVNGQAEISFNVGTTSSTTTGSSTGSTSTSSGGLTITSPASGATLSGATNACGASAPSGTSYVRFYRDGSWMNTDSGSPYTCNLDVSKLSSGTHKLSAVSYNSYNSVNGQAEISFNVGTTSTGSGTTGTSTSSGGLTITSPSAGATLSGATNACGASAPSGTSYVRFYRDGSWMNTDSGSPYTCNLDVSKLSSGTHKLTAVSYNSYNSVNGQAEISFNVGTSTSTGGSTGTSTISSSDIVNAAQGGVPFAQQSGYNTQCLAQYLYVTDIPETGMNYTAVSNGETIRLGKYTDPRDSTRKVLVHQVDPSDPTTSGAKRCEIKFPNNIQLNHTYWAAFSVYVFDWGTLGSADNALFGLQQHNGAPLDLSPNFAVYTYGDGRSFQIQARGSSSTSPSYSNTTTVRSTPQPIPFGRWSDFVFKFKLDPYGNGFLQVWQDGTQIFDFRGMLGYVTPGYTDFFKFGYYNWSGSNFASTRKVLLRSPVIVSDPTGGTYTAAQLRSYVNAH